jgi:hypothetical protein
MYYNAASKTYWAANCNSNNYGVKATTYGLAANPCHDCPAGMHTSATLDLTKNYRNPTGIDTNGLVGFTDPLACVTNTAYGFDGRIASRCAAGSWNAGGNHLPCTQCGYGLSTLLANTAVGSIEATEAAKQDDAEDCKLDIGFGYYDSTIMQCPIGKPARLWHSPTLGCHLEGCGVGQLCRLSVTQLLACQWLSTVTIPFNESRHCWSGRVAGPHTSTRAS